MGGGGSSSQQSSQSTSEARQALYTPSAASITDSINQLLGIYQQSTAQLAPFNQTAFDATNDMRYWQGMAGIDPALQQSQSLAGYMDTLKAPGRSSQLVELPTFKNGSPINGPAYGSGSQWESAGTWDSRIYNINTGGGEAAFNNQKYLMESLSDVNKNLTLLSTEQDPEKRQALYDQVMGGFGAFDSRSAEILKEYTAPPGPAAKISGWMSYDNAAPGEFERQSQSYQDNIGHAPGTYTDSEGVIHQLPNDWWKGGEYNANAPGTGSNGGQDGSSQDFLKQVSKIDQLKNEVIAKFKKEGNPAPTSEQVLARLQGTPGYTTQLNQGLQAIQNSQISKGLFASGRAAQELTRYGQDYAQNALTNQFNRSAQLAGLTLPSVAQQSQNTVAQAAPIMASTQLAGSNWSMSPWTQRSQSTSQGSSETEGQGMGGIGGILGSVMGGLF